jgi:TonB-linked SusC/RagA family outer membrane protein
MIRLLLLFVALLSFNVVAWAQQFKVQGVVQDSEGNTIPGVSVLLKGSDKVATTDVNGSYAIQVDISNGFLVFSFIGFKTEEVAIANRSVVNVTLIESIEQLQEIVVTALGVEKEKKTLGYATQSIAGTELVTARESNVINSLSGRVTGVQINQGGTGPAGTSNVVIRGFKSMSESNAPLYVIDGIPMTNPQGGGEQFGGLDYGDGISNISPDDVESFTVLKGPSATALYGSRGQNGVIMITTKKGKARKGIGIELNSNVTVEQPLVLPDFQDKFGRGSNGNLPFQTNGMVLDNIDDSWGPRTLGQTTRSNGTPLVDWMGEERPYKAQPNNIKDYFRTGTSFTNSVALSGGDEKTQARVSLTHLKRENIMPNSDFERLSVSLNIRSKLSDKFTVEGKINYINQQAFNRPNLTLSPDNPMNSLIQMPRSIDLDDLREFRKANGLPRLYTNATGTDTWQNPFWAAYLNTNDDERDRVLGYLLLEYRFNDWLKMHVRTGTDFFNDFRQNRNATNTIYRVTPDKSFYSEYYGRAEERNSDILFTASKKVSEKINFSVNLGANALEKNERSITNTAQGLKIPDFFVLQNARSVVPAEGKSQKKVHSVYGSAQFDYNDYLFVEITARNDWSSALPAASRSYFYPSVSTSLVFTEMIPINWGVLTYGKIRGSYAEVGNDLPPHRLDLNFVPNGLSHGGQSFGQIISTLPPVDLKPERTTSVEVGVEAEFFKNRLSADIAYYRAGTVDQILRDLPVSKASGFEGITINAGLVVNQGIEISLRGTPVQTTNFKYETYLNFTRNRSTVEELAENVERYQLGNDYDQFGISIQAEVGGAFGDIYANKPYLRDPATGKRIIDSNGLPVQDNTGIKKIGNFQPDFLLGFGHTITFKNITLGVLVDVRQGGDIFSFSNSIAAANGNARFTQNNRLEWYAGAGGYVADGVLQDGSPNTIEVNPETYWRNVGGRSSNYAEEFLYDGSFIKFREFTLGYSLPLNFLKKTPISGIHLSLVGRNLFILHKNTPGFDPEATFNSGNDQGIEAFAFPSTRSVGFNLKLTL